MRATNSKQESQGSGTYEASLLWVQSCVGHQGHGDGESVLACTELPDQAGLGSGSQMEMDNEMSGLWQGSLRVLGEPEKSCVGGEENQGRVQKREKGRSEGVKQRRGRHAGRA